MSDQQHDPVMHEQMTRPAAELPDLIHGAATLQPHLTLCGEARRGLVAMQGRHVTCPDCLRLLERPATRGELLAEMDRLRAENAEYWRAANRLRNSVMDEEETVAIHDLVEISTGNGYAHVPEPAVKLALDREKKMAGVLAEIEQTLGRALGYPVAGSEIGGDGVRVFTGEHTPATLAAEAARELERLRQRVAAVQEAAKPVLRMLACRDAESRGNDCMAVDPCDLRSASYGDLRRLAAALERQAGDAGA